MKPSKAAELLNGRKNVNLNNALTACRFKEVKIYYRHLRFQQNQQKSQQKKGGPVPAAATLHYNRITTKLPTKKLTQPGCSDGRQNVKQVMQ